MTWVHDKFRKVGNNRSACALPDFLYELVWLTYVKHFGKKSSLVVRMHVCAHASECMHAQSVFHKQEIGAAMPAQRMDMVTQTHARQHTSSTDAVASSSPFRRRPALAKPVRTLTMLAVLRVHSESGKLTAKCIYPGECDFLRVHVCHVHIRTWAHRAVVYV